jgi:hypothetical protein
VCDERDPDPTAVPPGEPPTSFVELDLLIDEKTSQYVYSGSVADVLGDGKGQKGQYQRYAKEAMALDARLQSEVVKPTRGRDWGLVAITREAEMFERLRERSRRSWFMLDSGRSRRDRFRC